MDIFADLDGKNPRRVAAGVRQTVALRRRGMRAYAIVSLVLLAAVLAAFFVVAVPGWVRAVACLLLAIYLLHLFGEWFDYRFQRERLAAIDAITAQQRESNLEQP